MKAQDGELTVVVMHAKLVSRQQCSFSAPFQILNEEFIFAREIEFRTKNSQFTYVFKNYAISHGAGSVVREFQRSRFPPVGQRCTGNAKYQSDCFSSKKSDTNNLAAVRN